MTTSTPTFSSLKSWLQQPAAPKQAMEEVEGETSVSAPAKTTEHSPPPTGSHESELSSDLKVAVPAHSVEDGKGNSRDGTSAGTKIEGGLDAGDADWKPEEIKTVHSGTKEAAAIDLSTQAGLEAVTAKLAAVTATLKTAIARTGAKPAVATPKAPVAQPAADAQKSAADAAVDALVGQYAAYGHDRGGLTAAYIRAFNETGALLKQAEADGTLLQALGMGGAGGGGGAPMPGGGGPPMPTGPEGAPPPEGGGEMGPQDMAGGMGEMGITPEMLEQLLMMLQQKAAPEEKAPPAEKEAFDKAFSEHVKFAAETKKVIRSGGFQFKPAGDGTPERARRDQAKAYLKELQARSA